MMEVRSAGVASSLAFKPINHHVIKQTLDSEESSPPRRPSLGVAEWLPVVINEVEVLAVPPVNPLFSRVCRVLSSFDGTRFDGADPKPALRSSSIPARGNSGQSIACSTVR